MTFAPVKAWGNPYPFGVLYPQSQPQQTFPANPYSAGNVFGIKGKFGNVLGKIGDALLIGSGRDPIYAANRRREAAANAMKTFASNPLQAIQDMANIGEVETAQEMLKNLQEQEDKTADNDRQDSDLALKAYDRFGAMAKTANASNWDMLRPQLESYKNRYKLNDIDIPQVFTPDWIDNMYRSAIDPAKAEEIDALERDRNADRKMRAASIGVSAASVRARAAGVKAGLYDDDVDNDRADRALTETERTNRANETIRSRRGGSRSTPSLPPAKYVGDKIRNRVTGKVYVWNKETKRYE